MENNRSRGLHWEMCRYIDSCLFVSCSVLILLCLSEASFLSGEKENSGCKPSLKSVWIRKNMSLWGMESIGFIERMRALTDAQTETVVWDVSIDEWTWARQRWINCVRADRKCALGLASGPLMLHYVYLLSHTDWARAWTRGWLHLPCHRQWAARLLEVLLPRSRLASVHTVCL